MRLPKVQKKKEQLYLVLRTGIDITKKIIAYLYFGPTLYSLICTKM